MTPTNEPDVLDIETEAAPIDVAEEEPSHTMDYLCHQMRANKDACEEHEEIVKTYKRVMIDLQEQLYGKMMEEGIAKVSTDEGSFTRVLKKQCSINPDCQDRAFELLERQGLGASIKRAVHFQTLNKHYREGELDIIKDSAVFRVWETKQVAMRRKN